MNIEISGVFIYSLTDVKSANQILLDFFIFKISILLSYFNTFNGLRKFHNILNRLELPWKWWVKMGFNSE